MLRFLRYAIEIIAGFVAVTIVLALLLAWRLGSSPVKSDFLTPYIEAGIASIVPDGDVHVGSTLMTWSGIERTVSVHADDIKVVGKTGDEIGNIPSFDAKISIIGLLFGQFIPEHLTITHPQIKLVRNAQGAFVFGGMMMNNSSDEKQDSAVGALHTLAQDLSRAGLMRKLSVTQAVFDVHDEATQKDWAVSLPEVSITRHGLSAVGHRLEWGGLDGHLAVEVTQKDTVATLTMTYAYDPDKQEHSLSTVFADVTPAYFAGGHPETIGIGAAAIAALPLSGKITTVFNKDFMLDALQAEIHGDEGQLVDSDFWNKPCPVKSLDVKAIYDRATQKLDISDTHIDFVGPVVNLKVTGQPPTQADKDLSFTASVTIDNLPMDRFDKIWPKVIIPDARQWMATNMHKGTYKHGEVTIEGNVAWKDPTNIILVSGGGKIDATNGTVTYMETLPPVENVDAIATFDLKKMDVAISGGGIGNIRLSPFTVRITGLDETDQFIDIPLQVAGPVSEILRLLDNQPLGYAKKLGIAPNDLDGKISGTVNFHFPLLKALAVKDLDIKATANTTSVSSTKLIPGIAIDQGNLAMTLDMDGFQFTGQVALDKVPFQLTWQEAFEVKPGKPYSQMTIKGSVKDDQWANFGTTAFAGTKGPIVVALDITRPTKTKSIYIGSLDMTSAAVSLLPLNWKKPAASPAILKFSANQTGDDNVNVTSLSLQGAQVHVAGDAVLSPDMGHLLSLNLAPFVVARNNASIHLVQSYGENGTMKASVSGASFDITGLGGDSSGKADMRPKEINLQVDKLYTSDAGQIDKAQIFAARDNQGWRTINLHGLADGNTPLSVDLKTQQDGHRTLAMLCDDFGKMMKGLGVTDRIKGGKFSVNGASSSDNPHMIVGKVKITQFTAQKLPVLALLLNATSPFGFTGLVTDSAEFDRFEGAFQWQGDELTLIKTHAAGSALGINMDGKVNVNSGEANLAGTLVPFSAVNRILNYIPLIGDLLTGGEDQGVLAVSYTIKGNLGKPDVSVNPVSLLTPGFIRNLFFRDDAVEEPMPESHEEGK